MRKSQASVALRPVENSAPLPHMAHSPRILSGSSRVPGHWEAKSSAVPGRHTAGWANEPRDKGLNYYYYIPTKYQI